MAQGGMVNPRPPPYHYMLGVNSNVFQANANQYAGQFGANVNARFPNVNAMMPPNNLWQPGMNVNGGAAVINANAMGAQFGVNANMMQPNAIVNESVQLGVNAQAMPPVNVTGGQVGANVNIAPPEIIGNVEGGNLNVSRPEAEVVATTDNVLQSNQGLQTNAAVQNNVANFALQMGVATDNVTQPLGTHTFEEWVKHFDTMVRTGADASQDVVSFLDSFELENSRAAMNALLTMSQEKPDKTVAQLKRDAGYWKLLAKNRGYKFPFPDKLLETTMLQRCAQALQGDNVRGGAAGGAVRTEVTRTPQSSARHDNFSSQLSAPARVIDFTTPGGMSVMSSYTERSAEEEISELALTATRSSADRGSSADRLAVITCVLNPKPPKDYQAPKFFSNIEYCGDSTKDKMHVSSFLRTMEDAFCENEHADTYCKTRFAVRHLKDKALQYWQVRVRAGYMVGFEEFKDMFKAKFGQDRKAEEYNAYFRTFRQKEEETCREAVERFTGKLSELVNLSEVEKARTVRDPVILAAQLLTGLSREFTTLLETQLAKYGGSHKASLSQILEACENFYGAPADEPARRKGNVHYACAQCNNVSMDSQRCFNCGKEGHMQRMCPDPQRCKICKEPGHMSYDCPQSKSMQWRDSSWNEVKRSSGTPRRGLSRDSSRGSSLDSARGGSRGRERSWGRDRMGGRGAGRSGGRNSVERSGGARTGRHDSRDSRDARRSYSRDGSNRDKSPRARLRPSVHRTEHQGRGRVRDERSRSREPHESRRTTSTARSKSEERDARVQATVSEGQDERGYPQQYTTSRTFPLNENGGQQ